MIKSFGKQIKGVALFIGIVLACSHPALANLGEFDNAQAVANDELDGMRGGFVTESGLQVSLGIIKTVAVDGVLKTVSTLSIPQLTKGSSATYSTSSIRTAVSDASGKQGTNSGAVEVATQLSDAATVVKNLGNAIVVQNSADGVKIRNTTVLNVTGNMKSMYNQVNLAHRISQQMINALH